MRRTTVAVWLALAVTGIAGCFTPLQPGCAFSCAVDHLCPANYVCGDDGFCHRADGMGVCLLSSADASTDAQD
jgi:hypothetical protein